MLWENYRGATNVPANLTPPVWPSYANYPNGPGLTNLVAFSANASNILATGSSPTVDWIDTSYTLCDNTHNSASPSCAAGYMGRVTYALVKFPLAGNYVLSTAHDDQVEIDLSSQLSTAYRSASYNIPVGALAAYTNGNTSFEQIGSYGVGVANACVLMRIYWNNQDGTNLLRLQWKRPDAVTEIVPSTALLDPSDPASSAGCAGSDTTAILSLRKTLGGNRIVAADQFTLSVTHVPDTAVSATTTGSGSTISGGGAATLRVAPGVAYTLSEAMSGAAGQSTLGQYTSSIVCTNATAGSATVLPSGTGSSFQITPAANDVINCSFTNTPNGVTPPAPRLTVAKTIIGRALPTDQFTVAISPGGPSATSTGAATTVTTTAFTGVAGTTYTLSETGAGTPAADLSRYSSSYSCTNSGSGGTTVASGNGTQVSFTPVSGDQITCTFRNTPVPELSIAKTHAADFTVGQQGVYTIAVTNIGGAATSGVVSVSDTLPAGLAFVSASGTGWTCAAAGSTVTCTTATAIAAGANAPAITLTVLAGPAAVPAVTNTAIITGGSDTACASAAPPSRCTATDPTTVTSVADLSIIKTGPASVASGGAVVYQLAIVNNGPSAADGSSYADTVPPGLVAIGASCGSTSGGATCATPTVNGTLVSGTLPTLPAGGGAVITVTATAPIGAASLSNTATVSPPAGTTDPTLGNNTSTAETSVQAAADLAVTKTVDNASPNVGEVVVFTVSVVNHGPDDATGVALTDGLPAGLAYVDSTPSQGSYDAGSGVWSVGALANGATATLTVTATVTQPGTLTNLAAISASDQSDPLTANNTAGASVNANPSADIQLSKTVDMTTPNVGANVTFAISAVNAGPDDATGIEITDHLPAGLAFVSASASVGSYDGGSGVWMLGSLTNGASATLSIVATVTDPGAVTNVAAITHEDQFDPVNANNQAGATLNGQQADISVTKTADVTDPVVDTQVTFTIGARNNGPSDATGVTVTDTLPTGLAFVSSTPSQGSYDPASGVWAVGALSAAGATSSATLTVVARVTADGAITNTALRSGGDQPDPNSTNDQASVTLGATASADLAISKTGPATVTPGGSVSYTVHVVNNGPSAADSVQVSDPLPAGLVFVGNSGDCTTAYPCSLGTLAPAADASITSVYAVPADYAGPNPVTNTASVTTTTPDPDTTNNQASTQASVGPGQADLSIIKDAPATVASGGSIAYTLLITNNGPSPANGATYADDVPAGITGITAACTAETGGAICVTQPVVAGNSVSGSVGTLPSSGSVLITISGTAPSGPTSLENTATVTAPATVTDPDASNNQDTATTDVGAPTADLSISKVGPAVAVPGGTITYSLTVTNAGPDDATDVTITDPTPVGLTFVSASTPCQGGFPCAFGTLAAGMSTIISVTYDVPANQATAIVNVASISSPIGDPDPSNNSATATTAAPATADLTLVKQGPSHVEPGQAIAYTLLVGNSGPAPADGARYDDPVPSGITGITVTCGAATAGAVCGAATVSGNDVSGVVTAFPSGSSVLITISGTTTADTTELVNTANVTPPAGVTDTTPDNNASTSMTSRPVELLQFEVD